MSAHGVFVFGTHTLQDAIMLDLYASEEWRSKYLEPLVAGEFYPSFAMTEPAVASSDPTQLQTTARLEDGEWVINGRKWFTSGAHLARYTVVMARSEGDGPPHDAFSMIVVPTDTPGYRIERTLTTFGHTDGDHCEVVYDNVRVPAANLLGERGGAFRIAQRRLGPGRIFHCMRWLGLAQRAYDLLCDRAVRRVAFGSRLSDKQLIQQMVFDTNAEIRAFRLMTLDAAARLDEGEDARIEIGIIKVVGTRMLHNAIDRALQVHGAAGLTSDFPLARMYLHARFARFYDGPDETHIAATAGRLLKPYAMAAGGDAR
jgi:acyl-CoA dehydrogenase